MSQEGSRFEFPDEVPRRNDDGITEEDLQFAESVPSSLQEESFLDFAESGRINPLFNELNQTNASFHHFQADRRGHSYSPFEDELKRKTEVFEKEAQLRKKYFGFLEYSGLNIVALNNSDDINVGKLKNLDLPKLALVVEDAEVFSLWLEVLKKNNFFGTEIQAAFLNFAKNLADDLLAQSQKGDKEIWATTLGVIKKISNALESFRKIPAANNTKVMATYEDMSLALESRSLPAYFDFENFIKSSDVFFRENARPVFDDNFKTSCEQVCEHLVALKAKRKDSAGAVYLFDSFREIISARFNKLKELFSRTKKTQEAAFFESKLEELRKLILN